MHVDDLLRQGKADAGFAAFPHVEALKDVGQVFLGDAVPVVLYAYRHLPPVCAAGQAQLAAGIAHAVGQDIGDRSAQPGIIAADHNGLTREVRHDGDAAGGITITPDFPEEPIMVKCDDTQMRRAVTNILTNGLRYARSELCLTCRADRRQVTIRIQDDGDGIAEADLPHIFDRFYMGKSGKSGIGLALTKEIIHVHKGTIHAYNGDSGAVFEVTLPTAR